MTTKKSKSPAKLVWHSILLLAILCVSNVAFSQLDSVSVSDVSFHQETVLDSLTNTTDTLDVMSVDVYTNDVDFLGEVIITVYEAGTNFPLAKRKVTKQEAVALGLITSNNILIELDNLVASESYRIEVLTRNYQGANLPLVVHNHN